MELADKEVMELGEGHQKKKKRKMESRPGCYQALADAEARLI
jgi:hypothetical protein